MFKGWEIGWKQGYFRNFEGLVSCGVVVDGRERGKEFRKVGIILDGRFSREFFLQSGFMYMGKQRFLDLYKVFQLVGRLGRIFVRLVFFIEAVYFFVFWFLIFVVLSSCCVQGFVLICQGQVQFLQYFQDGQVYL